MDRDVRNDSYEMRISNATIVSRFSFVGVIIWQPVLPASSHDFRPFDKLRTGLCGVGGHPHERLGLMSGPFRPINEEMPC